MRHPVSALVALCTLCAPAPAAMAEVTVGVYGAATASEAAEELQLSESTQETWGARGIWWQSEGLGFGLDYGRVPFESEAAGLSETLEILSINVYKAFPESFFSSTPYLGAGVGVSLSQMGLSKGSEMRQTGASLSWNAGLSYTISSDWSVFGEYNGRYINTATDQLIGGTLEESVITNSVNVGVSFNF